MKRILLATSTALTWPATALAQPDKGQDGGALSALGEDIVVTATKKGRGENVQDADRWTGFTPKVGLQWTPDDSTQVDGLYTRGFRSGGYNLRNTDPALPLGPFDQDTQISYEVGVKRELGRSRINVAAFLNQLKDLQREINVPGPLAVSHVIRNTVDVRIRGIEAEGQVFLLPNLVLAGQVGYVDGRYRYLRFDIGDDGVIDATDRALSLPRLSPWTYGAGLFFDAGLGAADTLILRLAYNHRDAAAVTDNNHGVLQAADMVDVSATIAAGSGGRFSLYGRNLLDEATIGATRLCLPRSAAWAQPSSRSTAGA